MLILFESFIFPYIFLFSCSSFTRVKKLSYLTGHPTGIDSGTTRCVQFLEKYNRNLKWFMDLKKINRNP